MNYLSRLAAQTGLTTDLPSIAPQPVGIEEIEVVTSPSPIMTDARDALPDDEHFDQPALAQSIEKTEPVQVTRSQVPPDMQEPRLDPVTTPTDDVSPQQTAPQVEDNPEPSDPEITREILLQRVMGWVASNEPELAPAPAEPATAPLSDQINSNPNDAGIEAAPPVESTRPKPEAEIPSLEIRAPITAPAPSPDAWEPLPSNDAEPAQPPPASQLVHQDQPISQSAIIEEKIEISIGTIHLDVTPPPPASAPHFPTQATPTSPPAPSRPSNSSRLARRFIRV